jgi:hypothetical protein
MHVASLRDYLTEHMADTFPDIPVWVALEGRVYEIACIWANSHHVILQAGEEEALSKEASEQDALTKLWSECFAMYIATSL